MVAAKIRTHILTTQPSEHKSDALNRSTIEIEIEIKFKFEFEFE